MSISTQQYMLIEQRIANEAKSAGVAYLLWIFTGGLGGHRFYLGRIGSGAAIAAMTIVGALTSVIGIGLIPLAAAGVWVLIDAFLIPGMISDQRRQLRDQMTKMALVQGSQQRSIERHDPAFESV